MRRQKGFTLIEILLSVAIIGIICTMSLTGSYGQVVNRFELENTARQFVADLRLVQSMARNTGTSFTWEDSVYQIHTYNNPYSGYSIMDCTTVLFERVFPVSVELKYSPSFIRFGQLTGVPNGGCRIMLYSIPLKTYKYIDIEAGVGRVRIE